MKATLHHTERLTEEIQTFYFESEKPLDYVAGQFVELTIRHDNPDSRGIRRWFTLSSAPTNHSLAITTRILSEGASTFKQSLDILQAHHEVQISDAMGDFVLPKQTSIPLIFIAGGIGITPFHSMCQWLADTDEHRDIHLIYGVAHEDDIIFQETFKAADVHSTIVVSKPTAFWGGGRGHITAEMILGLEQLQASTLLYLSGPEPLLAQLQNDLVAAGVPRQQIVTDFFPGYSSL